MEAPYFWAEIDITFSQIKADVQKSQKTILGG